MRGPPVQSAAAGMCRSRGKSAVLPDVLCVAAESEVLPLGRELHAPLAAHAKKEAGLESAFLFAHVIPQESSAPLRSCVFQCCG